MELFNNLKGQVLFTIADPWEFPARHETALPMDTSSSLPHPGSLSPQGGLVRGVGHTCRPSTHISKLFHHPSTSALGHSLGMGSAPPHLGRPWKLAWCLWARNSDVSGEGGGNEYPGGTAPSMGRHQAHWGGVHPSEGQTPLHKLSELQGVRAKGFLCPGPKATRTKSFLHFIVTRPTFLFLKLSHRVTPCIQTSTGVRGFLSGRDERVEMLPTL